MRSGNSIMALDADSGFRRSLGTGKSLSFVGRQTVAHIQLSKFEAIRAQLDAAIELFFTSDNVVATHTLVAAAYNALKDIAKREGAEYPFLKTRFLQSMPEEEQSRVHKLINEPENFFKHADRDPNDEILFNPELTELLLMDACAYFTSGEIERPRNYGALKLWVGKAKADVPQDSELRWLLDTYMEPLKSKGKREFWATVRPYLSYYHDACNPPDLCNSRAGQ